MFKCLLKSGTASVQNLWCDTLLLHKKMEQRILQDYSLKHGIKQGMFPVFSSTPLSMCLHWTASQTAVLYNTKQSLYANYRILGLVLDLAQSMLAAAQRFWGRFITNLYQLILINHVSFHSKLVMIVFNVYSHYKRFEKQQ